MAQPVQCPPFSLTPVMPVNGTVVNMLGQTINPDHVFNPVTGQVADYLQASAGYYLVRDANGCVVGGVMVADHTHATWTMPCEPVYQDLIDPAWKPYVKYGLMLLIVLLIIGLLSMFIGNDN